MLFGGRLQRGRGCTSIPHLFWPTCVFSLTVRVSAKQTEICKNWVAVDVTGCTTMLTVRGAGHLVEAGPLWARLAYTPYLEHVAECCLVLWSLASCC